MPLKRNLFSIKYDNLQDLIDVDDSAGRSVPENMNFTEQGYLTKDTGFEKIGTEDTALRHSLFLFEKSNGDRYQLSVIEDKLQSYRDKFEVTPANASNNFTYNGHNFENGDILQFTTSDTLPTGITANTTYYVVNKTTNTFQVSLTSGGSVETFTDNGTGRLYAQPETGQWETIVSGLSEGAEMGYLPYDDVLFGCNGVDDYFGWDGVTYNTYASAPKGNVLEVFEDRMFVTGVKENLGTYYYSNIGDPTTFDVADVIKPLGTDRAMTMKNYYGSLLLFKKDSIWKVTFEYNQVVALFVPKIVLQSNTYGACSKDAVVWVENDIWFFTGREVRSIGYQDNQTGVFGVNQSVISENIKDTLERIDVANFTKIKTYYHNRRFYLSVPLVKNENDTLFVCHLLYKRSWTKYVGRLKSGLAGFMVVDDDIFTTPASEPYQFIKWNKALSDGDQAIVSKVFFKRIEADIFNQFRIMRYLDLKFKNLLAIVKVVVKTESNDNTRSIANESYVGQNVENMEGALAETPTGQVLVADSFGENIEASPFIKKRVSFLLKSQAIIIGLEHDRINETFTLSEFILLGTDEPRKQFSGKKIISIK